jgi:competence protein ComEC
MPPVTFDFMDVGMGDCTFITGPGGETILIDFGSTKNRRIGPRDAILYLADQLDGRVPSLDYLFITHSDVDHYNQINLLIKKIPHFSVDTVIHSGQVGDYTKSRRSLAPLAAVTTNLLTYGNAYRNSLRDAPDFTFGAMRVWVLSANYPRADQGGDPNPKSIVLYFAYKGWGILCCGDATEDTEESILYANRRNLGLLECEVLKVPHHGSETSSSADWVAATQPKSLMVSADANPVYKLPRNAVLERYLPSVEAGAIRHSYVAYTRIVRARKRAGVKGKVVDGEFREFVTDRRLFCTLAELNQGAQYQVAIAPNGALSYSTTFI